LQDNFRALIEDEINDRTQNMYLSLAIAFIGITLFFLSLNYYWDSYQTLFNTPLNSIERLDPYFTTDVLTRLAEMFVFSGLSILAFNFGMSGVIHQIRKIKALKRKIKN